MSHTPGPWTVMRRAQAGFCVLAGERAITGWGSVMQSRADACLMAAAPELLEACKLAAAFLREIEPKGKDFPVIVYLDAAIAKATKP